MPFTVSLARTTSIHQGLSSPVRAAAGLGQLEAPNGPGRPIELRIGIRFEESDLTDRGWFLDTDAVAQRVIQECSWLRSESWTELFSFRPTMELVSRHVFHRLAADIGRLAYVELGDTELGVVTRYAPTC